MCLLSLPLYLSLSLCVRAFACVCFSCDSMVCSTVLYCTDTHTFDTSDQRTIAFEIRKIASKLNSYGSLIASARAVLTTITAIATTAATMTMTVPAIIVASTPANQPFQCAAHPSFWVLPNIQCVQNEGMRMVQHPENWHTHEIQLVLMRFKPI